MDFTYQSRPDHLRIVVTGDFDARRAKVELGNIVRQSVSGGMLRILLDARGIPPGVSIADRYDLATKLADMAPPTMRLAILVAPGNLHTKTLEDTAHNRGLKVRTTDSEAEAFEYLGLAPGPAASMAR
jgi:hypothetical protein